MKFLGLLFSSFVLLLLGCNPLARASLENSGSEPVLLVSSTDRTQLGVSESFRFHIKLDYLEGLDPLEIPEVGPAIQGLRILEPIYREPQRRAGRVLKERVYVLMADASGSYTLPPVKISVEVEGEEKTFETPRVFLEVGEEHASEGMEDILEIDGLELIKLPRQYLGLWILGGILGMVLLGYWLYSQIGKEEVLTVEIPAHEWALLSLEKLKSRDLPTKGQSIEYCHQLSQILRGYLSRRFLIPAEESTLQELLPRMTKLKELNGDQNSLLGGILKVMDLVRFAGVTQEVSILNGALERTSRFVQETALLEVGEEQEEIVEGDHESLD
ncbi:hypothetical protein HOF92_08895 [bacterium]|jgi:hypothetical protein|nr:hypothetical protein [bacterium]